MTKILIKLSAHANIKNAVSCFIKITSTQEETSTHGSKPQIPTNEHLRSVATGNNSEIVITLRQR